MSATAPEIVWQEDEYDAVEPTRPLLGQVATASKHAVAVVPFSHRIRVMATPEGFLRRSLLSAAGRAIDQAVLRGSGLHGHPRRPRFPPTRTKRSKAINVATSC